MQCLQKPRRAVCSLSVCGSAAASEDAARVLRSLMRPMRAEQGRADAASARTEPRGASGEDGGGRRLAWSPRPQGQAGVRVNPNTRGPPGVSREKPSLLPLRPSPTRRLRPMDWKIWYFEIWVQRTLQTIFQTFSFQQKLQNCICQELFFLNFLIPGIFQRKFTHMVLIHLLLIHQDVVL